MKELKVPLYESYIEIQSKAREEEIHMNRAILPELIKVFPMSCIDTEVIADASERPSLYGLHDDEGKELEPVKISGRMFLKFSMVTGRVKFDSEFFEDWYHRFHPDGKARAKFFAELDSTEKELIRIPKRGFAR